MEKRGAASSKSPVKLHPRAYYALTVLTALNVVNVWHRYLIYNLSAVAVEDCSDECDDVAFSPLCYYDVYAAVDDDAAVSEVACLSCRDRYDTAFYNLKDGACINTTQYGILVGIGFTLMFGLATLFAGRLTDTLDRRLLHTGAILMWSLACSAHGVCSNFGCLLVARVVLGIGEAFNAPACYALITLYFPISKRATANGIYSTGTYLGSAISSLCLAIAASLGWRDTAFFSGAVGVFCGAVLFTTVDHNPVQPVPKDGLADSGASCSAVPKREFYYQRVSNRGDGEERGKETTCGALPASSASPDQVSWSTGRSVVPQRCYSGSDPLSQGVGDYSTSSASSGGSASVDDGGDEYAPLVGGAGAPHEGSPEVDNEEVETSSCCISMAPGSWNGPSDSRNRTRDRRSSRDGSDAVLDASGRRHRSGWWPSGVFSSDPHRYTELCGEGEGQVVRGNGFVSEVGSEEGGRGGSSHGYGADGHERSPGSKHNLVEALKIICSNRIVLVLFAASSVRMIGTWSMAGYMATYYKRAFPSETDVYSIINAAFVSAGGMASSYLGGAFSDRLRTRDEGVLGYIPACGSAVAIAPLTLVFFSPSFPISMSALFFCYLLGECWLGPGMAVLQNELPREMAGTSVAILLFLNSVVCNCGPWVVAYYDPGTEGIRVPLYASIVTSFAFSFLLFGVVGLMVSRKRRRTQRMLASVANAGVYDHGEMTGSAAGGRGASSAQVVRKGFNRRGRRGSSTDGKRTLENGSWDFSGTINENDRGRTVCELVRGRLGSSKWGIFSDGGSISDEDRDRIEPVSTPVADLNGLRGRPGKDGGREGRGPSVSGGVGRHRGNYGSSGSTGGASASVSVRRGVSSASRASNGGYENLAERGAMLADGWASGMYGRRSSDGDEDEDGDPAASIML